MMTPSRRNNILSFGIVVFALVLGAGNAVNGQKMLIDDFEDGNDAGWTPVDLIGGGVFDASSLSYNLAGTGNVPAGGLLISLWDGSVDPKFSNGFLRATLRADTPSSEPIFWMRGNTAAFTNYLVAAAPSYSDNTFVIARLLGPGGSEVIGGIEGPPINVGEEWIAELGAVGDELSLKIWRPGEQEPVEPQLTVIDSTFTSGMFGVAAESLGNEDPEPLSATFDDIYFTVVPEPTPISVDIKPGSVRNPINLKSKGVLPVAIISTDDLFAPDVDVDQLLFGDPVLMNEGGTPVAPLRTSVEDISGDGIMDLTMKFSIAEMIDRGVLGPDSTEARLAGYIDGVLQFIGRDSLDVVPKPGKSAVPEPSTSFLAIVGILALLLVRRTRR